MTAILARKRTTSKLGRAKPASGDTAGGLESGLDTSSVLHGPVSMHAIETFSIGGTGAEAGEALPKGVTGTKSHRSSF
jgi:hypothetical protein